MNSISPVAIAITIGVLFTAGLYLIMARNTIRVVLGILILSQGTNLFLFLSGTLIWGDSPIIPDSESLLTNAVEPLTQALILTAIVISFGATAFLVVLVRQSFLLIQKDDTDQMPEVET